MNFEGIEVLVKNINPHTEQRDKFSSFIDADPRLKSLKRSIGNLPDMMEKKKRMKLLIYSDLHLEFQPNTFEVPDDSTGDVLILAGDIITFLDFEPLRKIFDKWKKPILYVAGNHEYYTQMPMKECNDDFRNWVQNEYSHVVFLDNQCVSLYGIEFFGGTMWTDFNKSNPLDMIEAKKRMNDYYKIHRGNNTLTPKDTVEFHNEYVKRLKLWATTCGSQPKVVISHHAPVLNPKSQHGESKLQAAYNSLDMVEIIETIQPNLWIYGHTHECDDQMLGNTRIVSNPRGYEILPKTLLVKNFDSNGLGVIVE